MYRLFAILMSQRVGAVIAYEARLPVPGQVSGMAFMDGLAAHGNRRPVHRRGMQ